jgi:glycosyltransferase involved in cell wall biosynthesis
VLSFSYCFPSQANPTWGVFVQQRLAAMAQHVELQVVSPAAWFPGTGGRRGAAGPASEIRDGITVHRPRFLCVPKVMKSFDGRFYGSSLQNWLDRMIVDWRPDILDAHFVWPDGVGVSRLARRASLPYSITLRGKLYPCLEIESQRGQCVDALRGADQVISVDPRMAEVAEDLGVCAERIKVIPNGVDLDRFQRGDRVAARIELGLPLEGRLIATVAHLGQRKGHHETLAALQKLPSDVRLVLVGGPGPLGGDGNDLRQLAEQLGVADRLIIAGKQPHELVPKYYQAADVSVLASWREGCPNTVLESLACGTPVVATDVGSVRWMINDGINGRVVPVRDARQLAAGIEEMLQRVPDPVEVRKSPAVRSWDTVAQEVLNCFSECQQKTRSHATST